MEPVKPYVDNWLLDFTKANVFSPKDFYEPRYDGVRLTLKLTPFLAEILSIWVMKIESVIEQVKAILVDKDSIEGIKVTLLVIDENLMP
jgi:hypothetical protein